MNEDIFVILSKMFKNLKCGFSNNWDTDFTANYTEGGGQIYAI